MTDFFLELLLPFALIIGAVLIWKTIKRGFNISQKSLEIGSKTAFVLLVLFVFLTRQSIRDLIEDRFKPEEKITEKQKDIEKCDGEARTKAEFSIQDNETILKQKEGVYLSSFLDCVKKKGYDLTEKDAQIIKLAHDHPLKK